jgi:monomeric sarcosine oxidase
LTLNAGRSTIDGMIHYDAIVLGTGGIGSAALYELARRGRRVLGIDRFDPPHDRGSSHGESRVIRQAYFEHPDYVPLAIESYGLWRDLERRTGRRLLFESGLLEIGPKDGAVVPGVLRAAAEHQLRVEPLTSADVERRWPGIRVEAGLAAVLEPSGGYLLVEDCVRAHLEAAAAEGAELWSETEVLEWTADENGAHVTTKKGELSADYLIITAGSWAGRLLSGLNLKLVVRRKSLFWFEAEGKTYAAGAGFPVFLFELSDGVFYGFPKLDGRGLKVAEHTGGKEINDPLSVDRSIDAMEQKSLESFLAAHLPGVRPLVTGHAVCLYTMSPDEHFIVDRHPNYPNVAFAAGLSGHGFKFAPVLGRALADLALAGETRLPIEFLSLRRFGQAR